MTHPDVDRSGIEHPLLMTWPVSSVTLMAGAAPAHVRAQEEEHHAEANTL